MAERIYIGIKPNHRDALGEKTRTRIIRDLKISTISLIRTVKVYTINAKIKPSELEKAANGPLTDEIIQSYSINQSYLDNFDWLIEIGFLPGVTDNEGRTAKEAIEITLGRKFKSGESVHTSTQYFIKGKTIRKHAEETANEVLANQLINSINIYSRDEWKSMLISDFKAPVVTDIPKIIPFKEVSLDIKDSELYALSRNNMYSLSLEEMKTIKSYYIDNQNDASRKNNGLPLNPTNVEMEILAQTWSEHCKHKIFNSHITYYDNNRDPQTISSLFKHYINDTTEFIRSNKKDNDICLSVFKDNSGVIRFNDQWAITFKVETHNSPSALDPYGGALTGIVGVNRDPFGTGQGCRLIANTDIFCFASPFYKNDLPPRLLHPRRIFEGVREGVEHGGNKSGIPTVNGSVVFDDRYLGKPLVYCGTLGVMPMEINGKKGYEKKVQTGDHIIMVGGRIGKDGIHGATFSSEALHKGSPAAAVQIGDPITQKRMTDFILSIQDKNLYSSITDNGAGGLSSSIGEMAEDTNGAVVYLERAPLKYHGLQPWEIFLSEAQERMTLSVPPDKVNEFLALADEWNVEATDLGEFNDSGYLKLFYNGTCVALLCMDFLHNGNPKMHLDAKWESVCKTRSSEINSDNLEMDVIDILRRLNICSKEFIVRQYDHEVQGGSVIKPLCGKKSDGPSDAAVIRPVLGLSEGIVISHGIAPRYSDIDTYAMASSAVDEAVRNAVCCGADPDHMAALDNFCWCDPVKSESNPDGEYKLGQLVRACMALRELCISYSVPLISGKDSMKNDYHIDNTKISIPPTLLVSLVAKIPDTNKAISMDFKTAENPVFLLGKTYREFGGSEYSDMKGISESTVPSVHHPVQSIKIYRTLFRAINKGYVSSCHDLSDGGLCVALTEMCMAGETGVSVDLSSINQSGCTSDTEILFSESQSRILVEIKKEYFEQFQIIFKDLPCAHIGNVTIGDTIRFKRLKDKKDLTFSRIDAKKAWKSTLKFEKE